MTQYIISSISILTVLLLTSCATLESPYSRWDRTTSAPQFKSEKTIFNERLNGKEICPTIGVANFTYDASLKPETKCMYPDIKIARIFNDSGRDWRKSLKVLQVLDDGFIVTSDSPSATSVFIHKTNEEGIVDNAYLANDPNKFYFYEYAGPYSYNSLSGKRTIQSFKKVDRNILIQAQKGLTSYYFLEELMGNVQLWDWADALKDSYKKIGLK